MNKLFYPFEINGDIWFVSFVEPDSHYLIDRMGVLTLGVIDPSTKHVYLANSLYGDMLRRVLVHELSHCSMFSYGVVDDIHALIDKEDWVDAEEIICNFIADYGIEVFEIASILLNDWR